MNVLSFLKQYADQIGGQFTDYDHAKAVVVVPLSDNRFQTVLCITQRSAVSGREQLLFASKICEFYPEIDLKLLLQKHGNFDYSKFVLDEGYLKIEASCLVDTATEELMKEMLQEVAQLADHYELKLTGLDVH